MAQPAPEVDMSIVEEVSTAGKQGVRTITVPWLDRWDHAIALTSGHGHDWPHKEGQDMRATRARIVPAAGRNIGGAGTLVYEFAEITVTYETPGGASARLAGRGGHIDPLTGAELSQSFRGGGEMITGPHERMTWGADGPPLLPDEAPGRFQVTKEYVVTRHRAPQLPDNDAYLGHANLTGRTALLLGKHFASETLLFKTEDTTIEVAPGGGLEFTVSYVFAHRPSGWNQFWRWDKPVPGSNKLGFYEYIWMQGPDGPEGIVYPVPLAEFSGIVI